MSTTSTIITSAALTLALAFLPACSSSDDGDGAASSSSSSSSSSSTGGTPAGACLANGTTLNVTSQGAISYAIAGEFNPDLTLCRGRTYTFAVQAPGHPFYVKTAPVAGTASAFSDGVTGNGAESGNVVFAVPASAPATLHYICSLHSNMTGKLLVID